MKDIIHMVMFALSLMVTVIFGIKYGLPCLICYEIGVHIEKYIKKKEK